MEWFRVPVQPVSNARAFTGAGPYPALTAGKRTGGEPDLMWTPNSLKLFIRFLPLFVSLSCLIDFEASSPAQEATPVMRPEMMSQFFESFGQRLREARPSPPEDPAKFVLWRDRLMERHAKALGVPPVHSPEPIEFETVGVMEREGYTLKKILFETRPGVLATGHLYFPDQLDKPAPAVLNVHGHWPGAKNAVQVHARCVFLAMRGFVVLSLDALGAGERAYKGITYHGRHLGYHPFLAGTSLAGLQVMENRRALDLLTSIPEVDAEAVGATGASGGGNQTFHLAILDPRIRAAVGVCFFGSYHGYLRGAHCACETVPGVLKYADEGDLAGLVAPRSLLIIAAKEDAGAAFRIEDARIQAEAARKLFQLAGAPDRFEFIEFEGGHDYSQSMRETMVAFFERTLRGRDAGESIPEPTLDLLTPEELRVLDADSLPEGARYAPHIAAEESIRLADAFSASGGDWKDPRKRPELRARLVEEVFGGFPDRVPFDATTEHGGKSVRLRSEEGVWIDLECLNSVDDPDRILIVVGPTSEPIPNREAEKGAVLRLHPRGTGPTLWPAANTVDCEDYLLAQGSVVLGRPMMGQWVWDILRVVEFLEADVPKAKVALYGEGVFGWAAMFAALLDERIDEVGAGEVLSSFGWPDRFDDRWGLVHFIPGLAAFGDIPQFAQGIHPRKLILNHPRDGSGAAVPK